MTVAPLVPSSGRAKMLILTKGPVQSEHGAGEINRGKMKRKLLSMLTRAKIPVDQVAFANITCWYKRDDHTKEEVLECREHLVRLVADINPNIIVAMGTEAFEAAHEPLSLYLHHADLFRSKTFGGRKLMPTYSPGMVFREWGKQQDIEMDLAKAWSTSDTRDFPMGLGEDYFVLTTPEQVKEALDYLSTRPLVTFDIETEGFNLFEQDEILCVQLSSKVGEGFVIPLRGAWELHTEDTYAPWQLERGRWDRAKDGRSVLVDPVSEAAHERDKRRAVRVFKPTFPVGAPVCNAPEKHDPDSPKFEKKGHICRGTLTNVLSGPIVSCEAGGRMGGKPVPRDYNIFVDMLKDFLEGPTPKAAQNGKFDIHGLKYQFGIRVHEFAFDTILAHHLVHEEIPHDLDYIRSLLTWMPRYNVELKKYVPTKRHSFALVLNEILWLYGAADADCEFRIIEPLTEWMTRDNSENGWLFNNISVPLARTLTQIEEHGILVNMPRLEELSEWYRRKMASLDRELSEMCHKRGLTPLEKWTNDNQLRAWCFQDEYKHIIKKATKTLPEHNRIMKGIDLPDYMAWKSKKTGAPSTGKKSMTALKNWCNEELVFAWKNIDNREVRVATDKPLSQRTRDKRAWKLEFLLKIEELKKATKAKNQFLDGDDAKDIVGAKALLAHIKTDGRVHSSYNQLIETARLSCVPLTAQILTAEGWKTHDQLTPGESVLGWDVLNRRYEWTPLQQVHRGQARLGTLQYRHPTTKGRSRKKFYPRSTANHKWVIDDGRISGFAESSMLRGLTVRLAAAQPAPSGDSNVTPDEAAIVGWLITDGWVMNREVQNRHNPSAAVSLNKPKSVAALRALLKPYPHTEHARTKTTTFYIGTSYYRQLMARCNLDGRRLKEESLEPFILALSQESRASMYEAMMEADGSRTRVHQERFGALSSSVSKESFLLLCALLGRFTTAGDRPLGNKKPFTDFHVWQVPSTRRIVFTEDDTESEVWCPQTALGTWVMRQNDEVFITGNSRDPNLQNLPNTGECKAHDKMRCPPGCANEYRHFSVRSMFTVPEDCDWLAADYRSEEVRIIAYLSQEDSLLGVLFKCECGEDFSPTDERPSRPLEQMIHEKATGHKGTDVHQMVASRVFSIEYDAVTKEQRRQCKSVTFGMAYGQTEQGLAEALGWAVKRAKAFSEFYFKAFPKLKTFRDKRYNEVSAGKSIPNALGRLRHTFGPIEMKDWVDKFDYRKVVSAMQRERLNYDTQSSAADIISLGTIALADVWGYEDGDLTDAHRLGIKICGFAPAVRLRDLGVKVINTVHDALEFECPKAARAEATDIIEKVMVQLPWLLLGWYLPVDITHGRYWDDVGDYDEYAEEREAQEASDAPEEVTA